MLRLIRKPAMTARPRRAFPRRWLAGQWPGLQGGRSERQQCRGEKTEGKDRQQQRPPAKCLTARGALLDRRPGAQERRVGVGLEPGQTVSGDQPGQALEEQDSGMLSQQRRVETPGELLVVGVVRLDPLADSPRRGPPETPGPGPGLAPASRARIVVPSRTTRRGHCSAGETLHDHGIRPAKTRPARS